jgi:hypothetical protein
VPIRDSDEYCVTFEDSAQPYQVPIEKITGEGEPTFHMLSIDPDSPITAAPPRMPEWLQENAYVTILTDGARRRGTLQSTDQGWTFTQRTASGRTTYTLDLADLPVTWEDRITEGSLELGWQATERAYHVSAAGITGGIPRSFRKSMEPGHEDRSIWLESYLEEAGGLKEQDTYVTLSAKEYAAIYSDIQIIPSMSVQMIKQDENRNPVRAKTRIVALGNYEETIWTKSEKYAPVPRDESSRLMISMAVERGRREKQGDCKNAFVQSYLPNDEKIIVRPPKGCPISRNGELWLLQKTLYGLRRSPYHWYQNIRKILEDMGLSISPHDPCIFYGKLADHLPPIYIGLYVDDFKYFSTSDETEKLFEQRLGSKCIVDFMGEVSWFLGCKYEWENLPDGQLTVSITQTAKTEDLIEDHGMEQCNPVGSPYRSGHVIDNIPDDGIAPEAKPKLVKKYQSLVGGLLWIQRQSRPDISAVTHLLSRHTHKPSHGHY